MDKKPVVVRIFNFSSGEFRKMTLEKIKQKMVSSKPIKRAINP